MGSQLMLLLEIMIINLLLSGDNAVVIAMASRNLPEKQRKLAIWWGTIGAVVLRVVLTFAAVYLLKIPYIQGLGSLLLLLIAIKLLKPEEEETKVAEAMSMMSAIWIILGADFVMSLDNVLAVAGAADGNLLMIVIGIALGIPLVVWGSTLIMKLLNRFPILIWLGAGILGYTAGEMLMKDDNLLELLNLDSGDWRHYAPVAGVVLVLIIGWQANRLRMRPKRGPVKKLREGGHHS